MRIGFIATFDPNNREEFSHAFSGIFWHMLKEFEAQGDEIEFLGPIKPDLLTNLMSKSIGIINRIFRLKPCLMAHYHPFILERMARKAESFVQRKKVDVVLSQATLVMSHYNSEIPLVYWRDANFADLNGTYEGGFTNIHPRSIEWANQHEYRAMNKAQLNIFSSECSYDTATSVYKIPSSKIAIVPFGANHTYNITKEYIDEIIKKRPNDICRLLFIGIDWERKGGKVAVEICRQLNQRGIRSQLDIVGAKFEVDADTLPYINMHGFVNKHTPEGAKKLRELFENSHFFIHPAQAEAYGCVLCEASSFGVPCIANSVGGIPTIVKNEKNGYLFSPNTPASSYVDYIEKTFSDYNHYIKLAETTFDEYEQRLNWTLAVKHAREVIRKVVVC